jgi:PAS domain S-box-containing protein
MSIPQQTIPGAQPWPIGESALPTLIRNYDWANTPLGPISGWPQTLKITVDIILRSPVAMVLLWGPDGIMLYNDPYSVFAGGRHPQLLGSKVLEGWEEVADFNRRVMETGFRGETLTFHDQHLLLNRNGRPEDVWLDLNYSPILGETGRPEGVLAIVVETTQRVLAEQQRRKAEDALRLSEERLSLALDASQFPGVWDWDVPNDRVYASERFAKLFGVDPARAREGAPAQEFLKAVYPEDLPFVQANTRQVLRSGGNYTRQYRVVQADGSHRWVEARGRVHLDAMGRPVRVPGVLLDITVERQAMEELRKNEERQRLALEAIYAFGTWDWDIPADVFTTDARLGELFLLTPEQAKAGVRLSEITKAIHPEDLPRVLKNVRHAMSVGGKYSEEYRLVHPGGTIRWLSARGYVQLDEQGRPIRFPGVGVDVTAEREALAALRQAEEFTRSVLESSPDCVKVLDLEGRLLSMNEGGCAQMEIEDVSTCRYRPWVELWQGDDRKAAEHAVAEAREGRTERFEAFRRTAKGIPQWWEVIVKPIRDTGDKPTRILSVSRDITERRRIQEQLRQTAKLESLGVMAGGIAHDFNNLLTGILGNASLLADDLTDSDRAIAREIMNAAERAAHLTKQMLAYSGKGRFLVQRINLSAQVRDILPLIQPQIEKSARLELDLSDNLPDIEADVGQMQQVIMNLVMNGSEALDGNVGTVTLSTSVVDVGPDDPVQTFTNGPLAPGKYVRFAVHDTGLGMSEEMKDKIFDPFYTTKFLGRGLGLAAVSGIVRGHRGGVRVTSAVGEGTLFEVLLPAATATLKIEKRRKQNASTRGTVLFVDDEETVRRFGRTALERGGFSVLLAENGREALDIFSRAKGDISLIVLDMMMPVMGGEVAFHHLRQISADVPIMISSGYNEAEVTRRFQSSDVTGFIQKPYTAAHLIEKVSEQLSLTRAGE